MEKRNDKPLLISILSMSLITIMAGAAVAPALGVIKQHFANSNQLFVQMIISMPALFIVLTSFVFPSLCRKLNTKALVMTGMVLYIVGGCAAGCFDNLALVLIARALLGIGVGIIMPLSTGLLSFYFPPEQQERLMGYSSAMNQLGGAVATLLSGLLSEISWRASFLVYLLGLASMVLCAIYLPKDRLDSRETKVSGKSLKEFYPYVVAIFLLMLTFFIYPSNFAIETLREGIILQSLISVIMAGMDILAFFGGLAFVIVKRSLRDNTKFFAPLLFLLGYALLCFGGWAGTIAGSVFIGFANGAGIPFLISEASKKAGKTAAATVMPMLSAALYLAQFAAPIVMSCVSAALPEGITHLPYCTAVVFAALFVIWSGIMIKE